MISIASLLYTLSGGDRFNSQTYEIKIGIYEIRMRPNEAGRLARISALNDIELGGVLKETRYSEECIGRFGNVSCAIVLENPVAEHQRITIFRGRLDNDMLFSISKR